MRRVTLRAGHRSVVVALLLGGFAARTYLLGEASIWWDEGLAIWAVRKPFLETTLWTASDVHPPLYFWLLWVWTRLVGESEAAARFLTVTLGMLGAMAAYAIGRRLGGRRAGVLALALVVLSRFEVWWSMELRMYALAGSAIGFAVYAAARWVACSRDGGAGGRAARRWLVAYVLAAVAAMYTVYLAAAAVAMVGLAGLFLVPRRRVPAWLAAHVAAGLLLVPWLALALPRMQSWSSGGTEAASIGFVAQLWATLLATGVSTDLSAAAGWTALFWLGGAVVALAAWTAGRPAGGTAGLLGAFLVGAPVIVWAATQPRSLFYSPSVEARYLLPFAVPAYAALAVAVASTLRRSAVLGALAATALLVPMAASLPGHYAHRRLQDTLQSMALSIWSQAEPGDVVVLLSGNRYPLFLYHYDRRWREWQGVEPYAWPGDAAPARPDRPETVPFPGRGSETVDEVAWEAELSGLAAAHGRVWLAEVEAHLQDPNGRVEAWLDERLPKVLSEGYGPNALHLYDPAARPPAVTRVESAWPGVLPAGATTPPALAPVLGRPASRLLAGDELNVTLWWTGEADPAARLHLGGLDPGGAPLAVAAPSAAPGGTAPSRQRLALSLNDRTPGGAHPLRVRLADGAWVGAGTVRVLGAPPPLPVPVGRDADFGYARLVRAAVGTARVSPGDRLVVDLYWEPGAQAESDAVAAGMAGPVVFAHLVGPPGPDGDPVWAGQDGPPSSGGWSRPGGGTVFDRHVMAVDPLAPPGPYELEVGLYDPETLERYPVRGADADPVRARAVVGHVTVAP